jgi:hypothetical protein
MLVVDVSDGSSKEEVEGTNIRNVEPVPFNIEDASLDQSNDHPVDTSVNGNSSAGDCNSFFCLLFVFQLFVSFC